MGKTEMDTLLVSELWRSFVSIEFTNRILFQRADNGLPWLVNLQLGKCEAANPPVGIG